MRTLCSLGYKARPHRWPQPAPPPASERPGGYALVQTWPQDLAPRSGPKIWPQDLAPRSGPKIWPQDLAPRLGPKIWPQDLAQDLAKDPLHPAPFLRPLGAATSPGF